MATFYCSRYKNLQLSLSKVKLAFSGGEAETQTAEETKAVKAFIKAHPEYGIATSEDEAEKEQEKIENPAPEPAKDPIDGDKAMGEDLV